MSGAKYDDYEKIDQIDVGAMGNTFIVKKKDTGKKFIMKKMNYLKQADIDRANQEKNSMITLESPYTVKLITYFVDRDELHLIIEYCEGGDLRKYIKELQKLPIEERLMRVWEIFAQIAMSVNHLHSHNVLHRDIKPDNILLMEDGTLKLGDFGLTKLLTQNDYATYAGTRVYLAQEVFILQRTTEESDIFAFGCVIYECLTGLHPFQGRSKQDHEIIDNIKNGKISQFPDWISKGMKEIVMSMLSKKPEDRPKASTILENDTIRMYLRTRNMNIRSNIPQNQSNPIESQLHIIEQQKKDFEIRLRTAEQRIQILENEKRQIDERARIAEGRVITKDADIQRLQNIITQIQSLHKSTSNNNITRSTSDLNQRGALEDTTTELIDLDPPKNLIRLIKVGAINRKAVVLQQYSIVIPLDKVIKDEIWTLSVRFEGCNSGQTNQFANGCIGIVKADGALHSPCFPGKQPYTQYMLDFHGNGSSFYKGNITEGNDKFVDGQLVALELDKNTGKMHFFIDNKLQPIYIRGINEPVKFYCFLYKENSSATVISLKKLPYATTESLANEKAVQW